MSFSTMSKSARGLWKYALSIILLFAIVDLLGFKDHVSILAGAHSGSYLEGMLGLSYLLLYFFLISIAPVLFIGGILLWGWDHWRQVKN